MTDVIEGEPSWHLSNGLVELWLSHQAGHLAPVHFDLGDRRVSPFAVAPWQPDEIDAGMPQLLKVLRGDFFCFPFGGSEKLPPHGVTANEPWEQVAGEPDRLQLVIRCPESGAEITKVITLHEGQTAVYQEHLVSGAEGRYNYGNHPILNFSAIPEGQGRVNVSPFRWASVYPGGFSNPLNREYGILKTGAEFSRLEEVPLATGGTTDLTRYPARRGYEDLVMMVSEPATAEQPFAWSAAVLDGYVWFSLKNPSDFPATLFWISNGGRHGEPWNGRHLGRLGIEEVCSHFADGPDVSREDRLKDLGIPTSRAFTPDQTVSLRLVQAVAAVPVDFGKVVSIRPDGPGHVLITGETGAAVKSAVDWSHVL